LAILSSGETLRLLLVSVREATRDEVGDALTGRVDDYRLYWVSQSELALPRAREVSPHVILVDDVRGAADMSELISRLAGQVPGAAILALVEAEAMARARQAVLAGARGFITKPLQVEEFVATLRQVLSSRPSFVEADEEEESEAPLGRTIVFCAPRGGTGRTTLAINTAISLRQITNMPVVLVDADYAAPALDVALNLPEERDISDLLPRLSLLDEELIFGVLARHVSGIHVLLAPPPADLASPVSPSQAQEVLHWLRRLFPWVIVDVGLPMDETAFAFLDSADRIILCVLPEMAGLRNTRLMLDQFKGRGYPERKTWLVLNRATMNGGISAGDIEERLHVHIAYRIPDDQPLATHSINRGVPLVMSHRRSALARAFRDLARRLAEEMMGVVEPVDERRAGVGFLRRLFRRTSHARV